MKKINSEKVQKIKSIQKISPIIWKTLRKNEHDETPIRTILNFKQKIAHSIVKVYV